MPVLQPLPYNNSLWLLSSSTPFPLETSERYSLTRTSERALIAAFYLLSNTVTNQSKITKSNNQSNEPIGREQA